MNTFDLQIQSTASDGAHTPAECVRMAKQNNVHTIAITDHDTVGGVAEAVAAGEELGVRVIPGIEFSCHHGELGIHLLGYGIDLKHDPLLEAIERIRVSRIARAQEVVRRLQELGFVVEYENVARRAKGGVVGRPHITYEILENLANRERLGSIQTMHDFIVEYISPGKLAYVEAHDFDSRQAIRLIHGAGGVAVWSHPAVHFPETRQGLEATLKELIGFELDGLEVFNPSHDELATRTLYSLSERYGLLRTAGSDFHRESESPAGAPWPRAASALGDYPTFDRSTDDILQRLEIAMDKRRAVAPPK